MHLIRLYCLRELVVPFLMSTALFLFIFVVGNLVKLADLLVNKGVGLFDVFWLLILLIPNLFGFILPTAALATVLLVFGGFAQHNEITAMKASGINVVRVMLPVMAAALLLSVVALFVIDQLSPRAKFAARTFVNQLLVKNPSSYIESGRFVKDFKGYVIRVQKVRGNRLEGVTIFQTQEGKPTRTIIAERGEVMSSQDDQTIGLQLYNGISDEPKPDDPTVLYKLSFDTFFLPAISLSDNPQQRAKRKVKELTLDELILALQNMGQYRKDLMARGVPAQDVNREIEEFVRRAEAEIQQKIAFSLATFCFVLIGLPLAIITRRGEAVVSFGLSMAVVAVYYILFIWGGTLAIDGYLHPVIALWIPNLLVVGVAVFLLAKVIRL